MSYTLVTGGTRGIGAAVALRLQKEGHKVVVNYAKNHATAQEFHAATGIPVYAWDVGDYHACQQWCTHIHQNHGPISILVNNAGVCADATIEKMTCEQWQHVMNVNLHAVFYLTKILLPHMKMAKKGRIISIGSVNGHCGGKGIANYGASKAALVGFTKGLAHEVAPYGITANVVSPGYIETDLISHLSDTIKERILRLIPVQRFGKAEEVAEMVAFLASDKSSFVTGSTFHINGGQWMN